MQLQYKIGKGLSVYHQESSAGRWKYPKPKDGYVSNGYYWRKAADEEGTEIKRLKIKRYKDSKGNRPTQSLLPDVLVAYQIYPVTMMSQILNFWQVNKLSITEVIDKICDIFGKKISTTKLTILYNLSGAQLYNFKKTFTDALTKYLVWQKTESCF